MRALLFALLFVPRLALAGSARQETEFHLDAPAGRVSNWIERHPADLERAARAEVVTERGDLVKLDVSDEHGRYVFWVKRSAERGRYREVLVETVSGALTAQQTEVLVVANPEGGCDVTIRMSATVDEVANVKIAVGCRKAIKRMRALVERMFGQPAP
jgi:hypothetical protein